MKTLASLRHPIRSILLHRYICLHWRWSMIFMESSLGSTTIRIRIGMFAPIWP
ncbi:MAG: hypothetical protein ACJ0DJ_08890 [bacterium]